MQTHTQHTTANALTDSAALIARVGLAALFLWSGYSKFVYMDGNIGYMKAYGMPAADLLIWPVLLVDSKAIITGDVTQVDLPTGRGSGLIEVQKVLRGVEGVSFCAFSEVDVVRHPLVQEVVRAYDAFEAERRAREAQPEGGK